MTNEKKATLTRREMLQTSLAAGAASVLRFHDLPWQLFGEGAQSNAPQKGKRLGSIEFAGEGPIPLDIPMGPGLDGRLYTDLSTVTPDHPITPTEKFYLRTRASELLDDRKPWTIKVTGSLKQPMEISMPALRKLSGPAGLHLMECSGNAVFGHFGMLSVADWTGTPVSEILASAKIEKPSSRVLISGFDRYPIASTTSLPGASWIFTVDELQSSKAFFATEMNGSSLTKDHGAPVRMVVPGWYGCTCVKWVNEVTLVGEDAPATSQMREFADRTNQQGVPKLAREYRPAIIEQAAMPIRIEKWRVDDKINYLVHGIAWGGSRPVSGLEIRFNPEEDFVAVDDFKQTVNDPWTFWTHRWTPKAPGVYSLQLRVKDRSVPSKRLDDGYYVRSVEITAN
jgi:DMSO/TMAO reductase YedYZ molybdopterin-dependent catalytic subunit